MTLHPLYAQTPGAGGWGDRAAEPATPQGGRAGLGCRAAVGVSPPCCPRDPPPSRRPSPACSETGAGDQLHVAVKL